MFSIVRIIEKRHTACIITININKSFVLYVTVNKYRKYFRWFDQNMNSRLIYNVVHFLFNFITTYAFFFL